MTQNTKKVLEFISWTLNAFGNDVKSFCVFEITLTLFASQPKKYRPLRKAVGLCLYWREVYILTLPDYLRDYTSSE